MNRKPIILSLCLVAAVACGDGDDPQTDPAGGNGQGNESTAQIIRSAAELTALGPLEGGDEIVWKDGTYDAQQILLTGAGDADNPIVLRAETPGGVRFTGASSLEIDGSCIRVSGFRWQDPEPAGEHLIRFKSGSRSCRLEECAVDGSGTEVDAQSGSKWVSLYGSGHTVTRCVFTDKRDMGALCVVWLEEGVKAEHTISHCRFSRPETILDEQEEPANEQETIRIGDSAHSMQEAACVVENNYFHHCNGEAQEIVSNKSCRNIYRGNGFFESKGTLTLRHGNDCVVSGNYFLGGGIEDTGGVRIIGEGHIVENNRFERLNSVGYKAALCLVRGEENPSLSGYFQVRNAVVRNNLFVDCNLAMHINYGSSRMTLPVVASRIEHNTAVAAAGSTDYVVRYESSSPEAGIVWTENTFFGRFKNNHFGLTALKERPEIPDGSAQMTAIQKAAGTSWE